MSQDKIGFQTLQEEDLPEIIKTFNFPWTSFQATEKKWDQYYAEQQANLRIVCMVKADKDFIGYGSLLRISEYPHFKDSGIPEIHDIWISEEYRGKGFGRKLIQHLEALAYQENYAQIGIGVGLYKDYGPAQKLYVQLGYIPDGRGVTYKYQSVVPGDLYPVDDDLVIWFKKVLS